MHGQRSLSASSSLGQRESSRPSSSGLGRNPASFGGSTMRGFSRSAAASQIHASSSASSGSLGSTLSRGLISVHSGDLYRQMMNPSPQKQADLLPDFVTKENDTTEDTSPLTEAEGVFWFQPTVTGIPPTARAFHASARIGSKLFFFGGLTSNGPTCDLFVLDTISMSWSQPTSLGSSPSPRYKHTMTSFDRKVIVIGGEDGRRRLEDVYFLDTECSPMTWARYASNAPTDMSGHSAVLSGSNIIVLTKKRGMSNCCETYFFNIGKGTWSANPALLGTIPLARRGHSAAIAGKRMLVFGGRRDMHDVDVVCFHTEEMRWSTYTYRKGAVPMSKTNHTCTVVDNHLVVIGGQSCGVTDMKSTTSPSFTDTFVLNTKTMIWHQPIVLRNSPPALHGHTANRMGSYIFVFGGVVTNGQSHQYTGSIYILQLDGITSAKTSWPGLRTAERKPDVYRSMDEMKSTLSSDDPRLAEDRPKKDSRRVSSS